MSVPIKHWKHGVVTSKYIECERRRRRRRWGDIQYGKCTE